MTGQGNRPNQTSRQYFLGLTVLFFGMLIGQVSFLGVAYYMNSKNPSESDGIIEIFKITVPAAMILGFFASNYISKMRLKKIVELDDLKEKFRAYYSIVVLKLALLEGTTFFSLIAYFISSDMYFLGLALVMIIIFFTKKPSRTSVANELELNMHEQRAIEDDNTFVT